MQDRSPSMSHWRRRFAALLLLAAATARAATPQDLTELSLEALMNIELPARKPSARFQVSATAVDSCTINATDLIFGTYDPINAAPTDASSTISVTCTVDSSYVIGLDVGLGSGASTGTRKLSNGDSQLDYSLYRDNGRQQPWGRSEGNDTLAGVGTGAAAGHTVYGRIPPRQAVRRGVYVDTITVSVNF